MSDEMLNLKNQLAFYMRKRGVTQARLSRNSGVPKSTISNWLLGTPPTNTVFIKKLADELGISMDQLCFGRGDLPFPSKKDSKERDIAEWQKGIYEVHFRKLQTRSVGWE